MKHYRRRGNASCAASKSLCSSSRRRNRRKCIGAPCGCCCAWSQHAAGEYAQISSHRHTRRARTGVARGERRVCDECDDSSYLGTNQCSSSLREDTGTHRPSGDRAACEPVVRHHLLDRGASDFGRVSPRFAHSLWRTCTRRKRSGATGRRATSSGRSTVASCLSRRCSRRACSDDHASPSHESLSSSCAWHRTSTDRGRNGIAFLPCVCAPTDKITLMGSYNYIPFRLVRLLFTLYCRWAIKKNFVLVAKVQPAPGQR